MSYGVIKTFQPYLGEITMYSVQHLKSHNYLFLSIVRGIAHFMRSLKNLCIYLLKSFEKAQKARIAFELNPYNSEEIKRIIFEK